MGYKRYTLEVVEEVRRLWLEDMPLREISQRLGMSRDTVRRMLDEDYGKLKPPPEPSQQPDEKPWTNLTGIARSHTERCLGCGGAVVMPCHTCDTRSQRPKRLVVCDADETLGLDLKPPEAERYRRFVEKGFPEEPPKYGETSDGRRKARPPSRLAQ